MNVSKPIDDETLLDMLLGEEGVSETTQQMSLRAPDQNRFPLTDIQHSYYIGRSKG